MDNLTAEQRARTMKAVRGKDTRPEMLVRRMVFALGYRFRLHSKTLPGCPDIVFPSRKKVIFVHGCFWHGHSCPAGLNKPASNLGYWKQKLERNRLRDTANRAGLLRLGWKNLVVWECELRRTEHIQRRIKSFLESDLSRPGRAG